MEESPFYLVNPYQDVLIVVLYDLLNSKQHHHWVTQLEQPLSCVFQKASWEWCLFHFLTLHEPKAQKGKRKKNLKNRKQDVRELHEIK